MDLRNRVSQSLKQAMKDKDTSRLATLRLINAAIKDQDIALRGQGNEDGVTDADILAILAKMTKQRQESARAYEEGGRIDLAEQELGEIAIIEDFLPRQLDEDEIAQAIESAIAQAGAESLRDMGRVMAQLKSNYAGQMDFGSVGPRVKDMLSG
ncbi:MAG: GatB/YqeY domain-containing protein [Pseudomonadota bacterium]